MRLSDAGAAFAEVYAALHGHCFVEGWSAEAIAALLAGPGVFGLIAEAEGQPQGFVLCRAVADEAETAPAPVDGVSGATAKFLESLGLDKLKGELPKAELGLLKCSRLIMGNNLIGGWSHSRDLIYVSDLFKAYNTERKIFETLYLSEKAGIDTMFVVNRQADIYKKYKQETGGKIQTICQTYPTPERITDDINLAIDNGFNSMYVQGAVGDRLVKSDKIDVIAQAVEHIKKQGYPAGIGAHSIQVVMACEAAGLSPDYYVKTCHHDRYWSAIPRENREEFMVDGRIYEEHDKFHDNIFDLFPEKTVEVMATVKKPWIGFKVLAGGAIHPQDGFKYAFDSGADFICVGMFDFQIIRDVNIALDALEGAQNRTRPWYG